MGNLKLYYCVDERHNYLIWAEKPQEALEQHKKERKALHYWIYEVSLEPKKGLAQKEEVLDDSSWAVADLGF